MKAVAFRMAELAAGHRLSRLGAEAVAAAESLDAGLVAWEGDDGPAIREAAASTGTDYRTIVL